MPRKFSIERACREIHHDFSHLSTTARIRLCGSVRNVDYRPGTAAAGVLNQLRVGTREPLPAPDGRDDGQLVVRGEHARTVALELTVDGEHGVHLAP